MNEQIIEVRVLSAEEKCNAVNQRLRGAGIFEEDEYNKKSDPRKEGRFNNSIEHESAFSYDRKNDSVNIDKHLGV